MSESEVNNFCDDFAINNLLTKVVSDVRSFTEGLTNRINQLVKIGGALSAEKQVDRLLEMIVSNARKFTNADGCTLYIRNEDKEELDFALVQTESLHIHMGGSGEEISWPAVQLKNSDGSFNERNVSAYCAVSGLAVNIPDVYNAAGFDFQGTKAFDVNTGYRSKSMLVIPMRDHEDQVIGVLQLLNALDRETGEVVAFAEREVDLIVSLASQAAIAVTNVRLIQGLEDLLNSFVEAIATAIDEKSPYTAGHIQRVSELTENIALRINQASTGKFAEVFFDADAIKELRMAAWMHDVGKITTPEQVVDKATKLEAVVDRIEIVKHRIEILKRDTEIKWLRDRLRKATGGVDGTRPLAAFPVAEGFGEEFKKLDEELDFLSAVNMGGEFLKDDKIARIHELAGHTLKIGATEIPLLNADEIENLSIRKGTLTNAERDVINNHVTVTRKMLSSLPFPRKLRNVPEIAALHHEKLDGSGYPLGLREEEIPLAARILAVADVFEALTAADRPYKEGKMMSESIRILGFMVKDNHLDKDICDLIMESGLVEEYARMKLAERQQDAFEWGGKRYAGLQTKEG